VAVGLASLCSTAGVASVENEPFQLGVYPNAASENITMLCSDIGGAKIYHITDQLGRVVLSGELNETTKTIQISQLQPAVYYFNVEEKGKLLATRRIIKY
jgi:hypothetical protein